MRCWASLRAFRWFVAGGGLLVFLHPLKAQEDSLDLAAATILIGSRATSQERFAARELQRYLYHLTGHRLPLATQHGALLPASAKQGPLILLGTPQSHPLLRRLTGRLALTPQAIGDEGYHLKVLTAGRQHLLAVAARTPVGVLYGVYDLLERLGFGFYLGGDALPPQGTPAKVPASLDAVCRPVFAIRGSLPWYNFLNSPTTWDLPDYKRFFEQMVKQRFNFVGFHTYDHEPFVPYEWQGQLVAAQPLASSLTYGWGAVRGLPTAAFGFGTGEYFDRDPFASRSLLEGSTWEEQILRSQRLLAEALRYAKGLGLKVCLGFELTGDPTQAETLARLEARIAALVRAYPMLDYVWFWQSEGLGGGRDVPSADTPLGLLVRQEGGPFAYLENPRRIAEAVRFSCYANAAYRILKRLAPEKGVIISGWGGDRWMRFTDFFLGLDRTLPQEVIFAALDNIDPTAEPGVSAVYGQLPPERQRWPIPWWESDGGGTRRDQWAPQCNTKPFVALCRDALAKGCQGLLAIHWRTRDVEEVAGFQARFAWNPSLTYEEYYDDFARKCYGPRWAKTMSAVHRELEALGPRWTGALGQTECGRFQWFDAQRLPQEAHLRRLRELRAQVAAVQQEMEEAGRREGLERIHWLLTTMDWLLRYDAAALKLWPGGEVAKRLAEAEQAHRAGDPTFIEKARGAYAALQASGLREALQTYPRKMSSMGEWGTLATINVKAYASFLEMEERLRRLLPDLPPPQPEVPVGPQEPPFILMRSPSTTAPPGQPLSVEAVVMSGRPLRQVSLHYRRLGEKAWHTLPMERFFRRAYRAFIPGPAITEEGLEFFLEAEDEAGQRAFSPLGFPAIVWSVTGMVPQAPPSAFPSAKRPAPRAPQGFQAKVVEDYLVRLTWEEPAENLGCRYELYRWEQPGGKPVLIATSYMPPVYDGVAQGDTTLGYTLLVVPPEGGQRLEVRTSVRVPLPPPPPPPGRVSARSGPGRAILSWQVLEKPGLRLRVHRAEGEGPFRPIAEVEAGEVPFFDVGLEPGREYRYRLTLVDRGGQEGAPSEVVSVRPGAVVPGPVFVASFEGSPGAKVMAEASPQAGQGTLHPPATFAEGVKGQALDLRAGGYLTFPYDPLFDLSGAFSLSCWVNLDDLGVMPVLASCGEWERNGWFLQVIGGRFRFYIGRGNVLDAGRPEVGRWIHVVAVFDGRRMALYQDGREVGRREVRRVDYTPWGGPLFVGQYHHLQREYQVNGRLDEVKLYQRALSAKEVEEEYREAAPR